MFDFNNDSPVYFQIIDSIKRQIFGGYLDPGQRMPPVRDLAAQFGVNPNTMQKALAELEREGLVYAKRTAGRFVTPDEYEIIRHRRAMLDRVIGCFLAEMRELGCSYDEVLSIISQNMEFPGARTIVNADIDEHSNYTGAGPYTAVGRQDLPGSKLFAASESNGTEVSVPFDATV